MKRSFALIIAITAVSLVGAAPALAAQTIKVSISGTDAAGCGQGANTPCATIQGALDTSPAADGDTIQVGPGVYNETNTLDIDKDVTITGAGDNPNTGGTSIVLPSTTTGLQPDGAPNPATGSPPDYAVAFIGAAGSGATVTDMTFNGANAGNPGQSTGGNYPFVGVDIYDASATLDRVQVTGIQEYPFGGGQYQTAVQANDDNASPQSVTVDGSNINAYQKAGAEFWGAGLTANITNTAVSGVGQTPNLAQDGVEYRNGAAGTVSGDTVTGNECDEPAGACGPDQASQAQGIGVVLLESGPVTVSGNTINNNDMGLFYGYPASGTATISGNVLRGDRYEGLDLAQGTSTVTGNAISDSNFGVQVYSFGGTGPGEDTGNAVVTLSGNSITHNQTGIETGDDTPSSPSFFPVVTAHNNDLSGNSISDWANDVNKPQNGTKNYWGCQAGPGHQGCNGPTGAGASQVSVNPFLASVAPFPAGIAAAFGTATLPLHGTTKLTFTITNPNVGSQLTGVGFSDSLPAGLQVAGPNGLSGSCGSGTITATAGSSSVSLSGATLAATAKCKFSVEITGTSTGQKTDSTGPVSSIEGGNGAAASASIRVVGPPRASIASPVANLTYAFGQKVPANYRCYEAQGGPGIASCTGTVGNGSPIDTQQAGQHTFTLTAKSADGLTAKTVVHYTVRPNNQFDASDVKAGSGGSVSFSFKVPGPGKLSVDAKAGSTTYGTGSKNVSAGQGSFTLQPNSTGKSLLQKNPHGVNVRLFITFTPTGGKPRTMSRPRHYTVKVSQ